MNPTTCRGIVEHEPTHGRCVWGDIGPEGYPCDERTQPQRQDDGKVHWRRNQLELINMRNILTKLTENGLPSTYKELRRVERLAGALSQDELVEEARAAMLNIS